jgi:peptidoglycan/LPS O-acetylase OafA/YrhL
MFGHLIEHLELPGNEIVFHASYFLRGVPIFFVISGFLIWFSISRSKSYKNYLLKRFWRIYPELWIAVIVEIAVVMILYRGWNIKHLLIFAITQGTVFQFWTPDSLRGYGVGTPNGTLWTIGVMVQFYVIAWLFYKLMKNRKIQTWLLGFALAFGLSYGVGYITHDILQIEIVGKLYDQTVIRYFWLFFIGMFIAEFKEEILPLLIKYWYTLLITALIFFWSGWDLLSGYYLFWSGFLTAGLIGFAYRFPYLSLKPDISYGIFLYQMIVVNVFVNYWLIGKWIYAFAVAMITIMCAYISTVTIGKWSARQRRN